MYTGWVPLVYEVKIIDLFFRHLIQGKISAFWIFLTFLLGASLFFNNFSVKYFIIFHIGIINKYRICLSQPVIFMGCCFPSAHTLVSTTCIQLERRSTMQLKIKLTQTRRMASNSIQTIHAVYTLSILWYSGFFRIFLPTQATATQTQVIWERVREYPI